MKKAIILITLTALILGSCNFIDRTFNKGKKARQAAERARLDSIAKAQTDSILMAEAMEQARLDSLQRAESTQKSKYYVIAGSFKRPDNATKYVQKMECEGYKPQILDSNNGYKLVSIASFESFNSAKNQVKKIRDEGKFQVWIYHSN